VTLQFICTEIERLRLQIRRQQKEVFMLQRSGIGSASAELLLARMQASVDALCIKRDKLATRYHLIDSVLRNKGYVSRDHITLETVLTSAPVEPTGAKRTSPTCASRI
jgi:hypothetical protein